MRRITVKYWGVNLGQLYQPMRAEFNGSSVSVKIMSLLPCLTWVYSKSMNFIHLCLSGIKNSSKHIRKVKMLVALSCPTLCDPVIIYIPPGSSVHGVLQARTPELVAILFSRVSSQPTERTGVSCFAGRLFSIWAIAPKRVCNRKHHCCREVPGPGSRT